MVYRAVEYFAIIKKSSDLAVSSSRLYSKI